MKRAALIVLDSLGIGEMPDASAYGDAGADTLGHIAESKKDLEIPNLLSLGLGNIDGVTRLESFAEPKGSFGFPEFPKEFMDAFEKEIGIETLGNYAASGTEIIEALGPEHEKTGKPIIYTSADSVFQIAANTDVIPLEQLYHICEVARRMLVGDVQVGRVIARPYIIQDGKRVRTSDRKDYAVSPSGKTVMDYISEAGMLVYAIGKIKDIFNGQGVSLSVHTDSNMDGVDKTIQALHTDFEGFVFTNLVDFDSKYGHRRDPIGYGKCIEEFDKRLPEIMGAMKEDDILILCADHGNDPVHAGWDHTREYVPVVVWGKNLKPAVNLGTRGSFADISATIAEYLTVSKSEIGESFLEQLTK
ncbi:MAG: phosphopentomutase [Bacillota bacterium]|nr:phosphopentomutase [Bacillota bacterium]